MEQLSYPDQFTLPCRQKATKLDHLKFEGENAIMQWPRDKYKMETNKYKMESNKQKIESDKYKMETNKHKMETNKYFTIWTVLLLQCKTCLFLAGHR